MTSHVADDNQDSRIETLELKLMDLENTMQELHEVILRQYRDIERLQLQQEELLKRAAGAGSSDRVPSASDELPPHY